MVFLDLARHASRQQENQLSESFFALYKRSGTFRRCMARLLTTRIGDPITPDWRCSTQPEKRMRSGARIVFDIELSSPDGTKTVVLENKVGSPLTARQLKKYQRSPGKPHVVALTTAHPELSSEILEQMGVSWLRWQDIYVSMRRAQPTRPIEKFLFIEFAEYLVQKKFVFAEELTSADLKRIGNAFRAIDGRVGRYRKTMLFGLRDAASLAALLDDVKDALRRNHFRTWTATGPYCGQWLDEDYDHFYMGFNFKRKASRMMLGFEFYFDGGDGKPSAGTYWHGYGTNSGSAKDVEKNVPLRQLLEDGRVSPRRVESLLENYGRKVGVL